MKTTVDSRKVTFGNTGRTPSIALDKKGRVHIGYYDPLNYDLMYTTGANNTGGNNETGKR